MRAYERHPLPIGSLFPSALIVYIRSSPWLAYVASVSAGNTFTYVENLPGKLQLVYGFRFAPFYRSRSGFLKTMRVEMVALYVYFPGLHLEKSLLLPVLPYVYWQWGGGA